MRLVLIIVFSLAVSAQTVLAQAKFKFEEETFDFGSFKEETGSVQHKFVFTNIGDAPLVIQGVRASCGCTTPAWSREPISPGEKGFITAKYNPKNRPGSFRKSLTVTSNAQPSSKVIYIMGMVENRPKTIADQYRFQIGDMRFRYQSMNMGTVTTEKPLTRSFNIYNDGDRPITFFDMVDKPDYITVSIQPHVIAPKTAGKIIISYDGKMKNDYGYVSDPIRLYTDEENDNEKNLRVIASVQEYFPPMTAEQLALAPKISFESTVYDFGSIKKNGKAQTEFIFTNTGKSDLNIRALKPNCGCTVVELSKDTYAPGESGTITVEFDATGRLGSQQKSIAVFSNDPRKPSQSLTLKAKIQDVS